MITETKAPMPNGRPPKNASNGRYFQSELHTFLVGALPSDFITDDGFVNALKLSQELHFSRYHIYRHLGENRLTPKIATKLIALSNSTHEADKKGLISIDKVAHFVIAQ